MASEVSAHKCGYVIHIFRLTSHLTNNELIFGRDISIRHTHESYLFSVDALKVLVSLLVESALHEGQGAVDLVIIIGIYPYKFGLRVVESRARNRPNGLSLVSTNDDGVVAILESLVDLISETAGILDHSSSVIMHDIDFILRR